jgi:hypothetical protein
MRPRSVQTASSSAGEPTDFAMPAGVRKMPTPIVPPITSPVAATRPMRRSSPLAAYT